LQDAATVALIRPGDPFDVFLVKRASKSGFMGGMYVFPGGKLDSEDSDPAILACMPDSARHQCKDNLEATPQGILSGDTAAALHVASIREVFEEAGVLLARRDKETDYVRLDDSQTQQRFSDWRLKLRNQEVSLADILRAEKLSLAVDNLIYFAHWLTPSRERRRYDTRFFVAYQPDGQEPVIDEHETVDGVWRSPQAAIADYRRGDIALAPPTLRILEDIGAHDSVDSLMEWAKARRVWPIMPRVGIVDEKISILLPWDPNFDATEGESIEGLPRPHPMAQGPSRVVLEGEQWFSRGGPDTQF
jgi:8-oxo-dGTP pyrophosphatase MutT (NUDIX family)